MLYPLTISLQRYNFFLEKVRLTRNFMFFYQSMNDMWLCNIVFYVDRLLAKEKMIYLHNEEKPKTIADEKNAIISIIVPFHNNGERASGGSIA